MLGKMERELDFQEMNIRAVVQDRRKQGEREVVAAEHLLKNVKGAFRVQKEQLDKDQDRIVKEIQAYLKNDELQWDQILVQVRYRLQQLQSFDKTGDFAEGFNAVSDILEKEERDRENDDQDIIDMLNDICIKMYNKIAAADE